MHAAMASAIQLAAGTDCTVVCRSSVGGSRAARVEMHQAMVLVTGRRHVLQRLQDAQSSGATFACIILAHAQDEAALRLLPSDVRDGPAAPKRGRAS